MFYNAIKFNQPIGKWNINKVHSFSFMFHLAINFNQDLNLWKISIFKDTRYMFNNANSFNKLNCLCVLYEV